MTNGRPWSWPIFFDRFWIGFGRMMAGFSAVFIIGPLIADTSSTSFESAVFGLLFAVVCSGIYGFSEGESAVRAWRNKQSY
jgi:hypothetical protein